MIFKKYSYCDFRNCQSAAVLLWPIDGGTLICRGQRCSDIYIVGRRRRFDGSDGPLAAILWWPGSSSFWPLPDSRSTMAIVSGNASVDRQTVAFWSLLNIKLINVLNYSICKNARAREREREIMLMWGTGTEGVGLELRRRFGWRRDMSAQKLHR